MNIAHLLPSLDMGELGERMHKFIAELYPICRSITGPGTRQTLNWIAKRMALTIHEVPTGTKVLDWTVPNEWTIREAWVKDSRGIKVIDFERSNLHLVNYSRPYHGHQSLAELKSRIHTLPDRPDWIPYRTSYYKEDWGFCLAHRQLEQFAEDNYEVRIDSELRPGFLSYGEAYLPGRKQDEILFSTHVCHPSLCNDNLSGVVMVMTLAALMAEVSREYSYRFLFLPGTIGSITWLARNEEITHRIRHGLVVACVGDSGKLHYKRTRQGQAEIDRAATVVLRHRPEGGEVRDFSPYGYDERQYNSPGFNLAVGSLTRTPHGQFPQYHTSADDLEFVTATALADSLHAYLSVIEVLEQNRRFLNLNPKCEPQLGRRGLYRSIGGLPDAGRRELALLWVLNLSDGHHDLLAIAERSGLPFSHIARAAADLRAAALLEEVAS